MPEVIFQPIGITVIAAAGKSLLDLAFENDIILEHNCGGICACTSCRVIIKKGMDLLEQKSEEEKLQLSEAGYTEEFHRLSCCCKINDGLPGKKIIVEIPQIPEDEITRK